MGYEAFKPVVGHEKTHGVSNCGRVRNADGRILVSHGVQVCGRDLTFVSLKGKACCVEEMVAEAFIGPCPVGKMVGYFQAAGANMVESLGYERDPDYEPTVKRGEKWKKVVGWEDTDWGEPGYMVSTYGRVRDPAGDIMLQSVRNGVLTVRFLLYGYKRYPSVPVLVANAFLGLKPKGKVLKHGSLGEFNHHASNLFYAPTPKCGVGKPRIRKCVVHGEYFINIKSAAKHFDISAQMLSRALRSGQPTYKGWRINYAD
jgi:hypothetical protein